MNRSTPEASPPRRSATSNPLLDITMYKQVLPAADRSARRINARNAAFLGVSRERMGYSGRGCGALRRHERWRGQRKAGSGPMGRSDAAGCWLRLAGVRSTRVSTSRAEPPRQFWNGWSAPYPPAGRRPQRFQSPSPACGVRVRGCSRESCNKAPCALRWRVNCSSVGAGDALGARPSWAASRPGARCLRQLPGVRGLSPCHRHGEFATRTGSLPSARAPGVRRFNRQIIVD